MQKTGTAKRLHCNQSIPLVVKSNFFSICLGRTLLKPRYFYFTFFLTFFLHSKGLLRLISDDHSRLGPNGGDILCICTGRHLLSVRGVHRRRSGHARPRDHLRPHHARQQSEVFRHALTGVSEQSLQRGGSTIGIQLQENARFNMDSTSADILKVLKQTIQSDVQTNGSCWWSNRETLFERLPSRKSPTTAAP